MPAEGSEICATWNGTKQRTSRLTVTGCLCSRRTRTRSDAQSVNAKRRILYFMYYPYNLVFYSSYYKISVLIVLHCDVYPWNEWKKYQNQKKWR